MNPGSLPSSPKRLGTPMPALLSFDSDELALPVPVIVSSTRIVTMSLTFLARRSAIRPESQIDRDAGAAASFRAASR
jgi:hypothetical protein